MCRQLAAKSGLPGAALVCSWFMRLIVFGPATTSCVDIIPPVTMMLPVNVNVVSLISRIGDPIYTKLHIADADGGFHLRLRLPANKAEAITQIMHPRMRRRLHSPGLPPAINALPGNPYLAFVARLNRERQFEWTTAREHDGHVLKERHILK